jgi:hypothetical protein
MTITLSTDLLIGLAVGFFSALILMNIQTVSTQAMRNPPCGCGCLLGVICFFVGAYLLVLGGYWSF